MRKIVLFLILFVFLCSSLYALDTTLKDIRDQVYNESRELKKMMSKTQDPVFLSSMWDSCLIATIQLDAYFHMINLFNTIKQEDLNESAVDSLTDWLNTIKEMNKLNIESLGSTAKAFDQHTKIHMGRLKTLYSNLNKQLDAELKKVSAIKKSLKLR
ncbi:hypothetical protein OAA99_02235 [Omnitrophica bacterium]|nr:hypothetical protein [Candidatus Omnitrophota bacterium]